jgi:MYXO-CTERM domain-containing protein
LRRAVAKNADALASAIDGTALTPDERERLKRRLHVLKGGISSARTHDFRDNPFVASARRFSMQRWLGLMGVLWLSACGDAAVANVSAHHGLITQPILRGHPARANEHWGTVALVVTLGQDDWLCTGTLIAPKLVVTAAHCVKDEYTFELASSVLVIAGASDVDGAQGDQVYEASRFLAHPRALEGDDSLDPTGLGADYDIAIVELESKITQVTPVPIVALDTLDQVLREGAELTIAGYGTRVLDENTGLSDQDGAHYVGTQHFVRRSDTEFLAGSMTDADTCPGDSGGPAYLTIDGEAWLVGATSRGRDDYPNVDCGEGGIYTLVPAFRSWIDQSASPAAWDDGPDDGDTAGRSEQGDGSDVSAENPSMRRHGKSGCSVAPPNQASAGSLLTLLGLCALALTRRASR